MDQSTFPVTFVTARTHLGKTYTNEGSRRPPHAKNLTSMEYPLTADRQGIETLAKLVARHTGAGVAFFTGKFRKPLIDESRAGQADSQFRPQVLVVDLDDVDIDLAITPPLPMSIWCWPPRYCARYCRRPWPGPAVWRMRVPA